MPRFQITNVQVRGPTGTLIALHEDCVVTCDNDIDAIAEAVRVELDILWTPSFSYEEVA